MVFYSFFQGKLSPISGKNNRELSGCQDGGRICGGEKWFKSLTKIISIQNNVTENQDDCL